MYYMSNEALNKGLQAGTDSSESQTVELQDSTLSKYGNPLLCIRTGCYRYATNQPLNWGGWFKPLLMWGALRSEKGNIICQVDKHNSFVIVSLNEMCLSC